MTSVSLWKRCSVEDFFTRHNWEGKVDRTTALEETPPITLEPALEEWLDSHDSPLEETLDQLVHDLLPEESHLLVDPRQDTHYWMTLSVTQFFREQNWTGKPEPLPLLKKAEKKPSSTQKKTPVSSPVSSHPAPESSFSLTLSVTRFFANMEWEGQPQIGVIPMVTRPVEGKKKDDSMTLKDLSHLF